MAANSPQTPHPGGTFAAAMLARGLGLLRETADQSTADGRARERRRRATLSAGMSLLAKLVSVATALITVPLTLHYLGPERYGMRLIMSSLVAMLSFADFGVGNGVLNVIAAAHGHGDAPAMRRAISSGMVALGGIAIAILAGFAIAYPLVPWHRLFNVRSALARAEAGPALAAFVICFALAIPTGIVQRVQMGLQRGFLASVWQCGGSLLALAGVLIAIQFEAGLPWLVLAFVGSPLVAMLANSVMFFGRIRPDIAPRLASATRAAGAQVMRTGLLFLLLQVAAAVTYNSDNLIIAQLLGASLVPQYAVPERLFSLITMVASMALQPLWPAYRESIVRGDIAWTRATLRRSMLVAVGWAAALSLALTIAMPWVLPLWVGHAVDPPIALILGLAVWKVIEAAGIALAMFMNGAHVVKPQVIFASLTAIVSIVLEIILVRAIGVSGAVWATVVAFFVCALIPYAVLTPRILRRLGPAR